MRIGVGEDRQGWRPLPSPRCRRATGESCAVWIEARKNKDLSSAVGLDRCQTVEVIDPGLRTQVVEVQPDHHRRRGNREGIRD